MHWAQKLSIFATWLALLSSIFSASATGEAECQTNSIRRNVPSLQAASHETMDLPTFSALQKRLEVEQPQIALILPWVGRKIPEFVGFVCQTVAPSAGFVDLLLVVEGAAVPNKCRQAPNVKVIDLGEDGIARIHAEKMAEPGGNRNNSFADFKREFSEVSLFHSFRKAFRTVPTFMVTFKPAWGRVFEDFIRDYSHWTWVDGDQIFGDLRSFVTSDELEHFDAVVYTYEGDVNRSYFRGQWALQKNTKNVTMLFQNCSHLTGSGLLRTLERYIEKDRMISAEGCIADVFLGTPGVSVKFTPKMFSDHKLTPVYYKAGHLCRGDATACSTAFRRGLGGTCIFSSASEEQWQPIDPRKVHVGGDGGNCSNQGWLQPYGSCIQMAANSFDSIVKRGDSSFFHVPGWLNCPGSERSSTGVNVTEAAIFHYRMWQDTVEGKSHTMNFVEDDDESLTIGLTQEATAGL